ncbi:hypothetical protein [Bradyrhizobium ivorense]|uniref:hypothetical protein n=1 Tax=Bradyrhizobium ivorense TaxID=2511166 RepID=UPI0011166BA6|nr:hypothetical protein [Bradyrhizobium ivorense]MCC8936869.1 hypothetical protein [Bradyrhizobium ivorense]
METRSRRRGRLFSLQVILIVRIGFIVFVVLAAIAGLLSLPDLDERAVLDRGVPVSQLEQR